MDGNKVERWVPRWMRFVPSAYTERGGVGTVRAASKVEAAQAMLEDQQQSAAIHASDSRAAIGRVNNPRAVLRSPQFFARHRPMDGDAFSVHADMAMHVFVDQHVQTGGFGLQEKQVSHTIRIRYVCIALRWWWWRARPEIR